MLRTKSKTKFTNDEHKPEIYFLEIHKENYLYFGPHNTTVTRIRNRRLRSEEVNELVMFISQGLLWEDVYVWVIHPDLGRQRVVL